MICEPLGVLSMICFFWNRTPRTPPHVWNWSLPLFWERSWFRLEFLNSSLTWCAKAPFHRTILLKDSIFQVLWSGIGFLSHGFLSFFPKFLLPFWWRISLVPSSIKFMQLVLATCCVQWLGQFLSLGQHDAGPPSDDFFEMVHFSTIYSCIWYWYCRSAKLCWESIWISIMMFYQHYTNIMIMLIWKW